VNHWWRAYNEAVDDPKLQRLPDATFKAWFNLMCLASRNDGALPPIEDIAFSLRLSTARVNQIIADLKHRELLDVMEDGTLQPHNWNGRQYKSDVSTERVKRFRKRKRNVPFAATGTPPDTDSEAERKEPSQEVQTIEGTYAPPVRVVNGGRS
jgi:hypothetical protein